MYLPSCLPAGHTQEDDRARGTLVSRRAVIKYNDRRRKKEEKKKNREELNVPREQLALLMACRDVHKRAHARQCECTDV